MKRIALFLLQFSFLMAMAQAQQVWTEGTQWDVEYNDGTPRTVFELISPVEIDGISYFPLIAKQSEQCDTLGFIRSERGDTLIYCRVFYPGMQSLSDDLLLYDFSKSFEYGDTIRYGTLDGVTILEVIDAEEDCLDYYYNVLEEGDCLPSWKGIVYKIGYLEGPMVLFFNNIESTTVSSKRPKPTNVSHTLFTSKKKRQAQVDLSNDIQRIEVRNGSKTFYTLDGSNCRFNGYNIVIYEGKKYLVPQGVNHR